MKHHKRNAYDPPENEDRNQHGVQFRGEGG